VRRSIVASCGSPGRLRPGSERAIGMTTNILTISLVVLSVFFILGSIGKLLPS
jgi:hypothetical protein